MDPSNLHPEAIPFIPGYWHPAAMEDFAFASVSTHQDWPTNRELSYRFDPPDNTPPIEYIYPQRANARCAAPDQPPSISAPTTPANFLSPQLARVTKPSAIPRSKSSLSHEVSRHKEQRMHKQENHTADAQLIITLEEVAKAHLECGAEKKTLRDAVQLLDFVCTWTLKLLDKQMLLEKRPEPRGSNNLQSGESLDSNDGGIQLHGNDAHHLSDTGAYLAVVSKLVKAREELKSMLAKAGMEMHLFE